MLTRPFTRLVVAFGQRKVTQRRFVEEIVLGIWILIPFGFFMGLLTSRICTKIHFSAIRSDIWTTIVVFLIGDILMEWLLPSLSCLPMAGQDAEEFTGDYYYDLQWLLQSYGLTCPPDFASSATLLSPDATAILFSLRLVFLSLGVHMGESLCFVALTGGIATGKSTVSKMLVDYSDTKEYLTDTGISNNSSNGTNTQSSNSGRNRRKKSNSGSNSNNNTTNESSSNDTTEQTDSDEYKEGTVNLICADTIAHEILLSPSLLANEPQGEYMHPESEGLTSDGGAPSFVVHPSDSVYDDILEAFEGHDILDDSSQIDRLKLGAIVFQDVKQRRKLNSITHPRILLVLLQRMVRSVFFGNSDLTVADIPLLFESGMLSWLFAVTICVTVADPSVQLDRLCKRNPDLSKEECQARIDSQLPLERKEQKADIVIDNSGDLEELRDQVEYTRRDLMGRLYGIGMSLLQMLLLIGGSTSIAVSSKFYSHWQQ